jgi:spore germination protein KC
MNRKLLVLFIFVSSMFVLSGCWDSMELNDRAIELAWGLDKAKNKNIEVSTQVIIPSKVSGGQGTGSTGGSPGNPYFVETGTGKDTIDAVQQMQTKLSRKIFRGQRRIIVIGESLARKGIKGILDTYTRDPSINLLTDIFVIKGGTAKEFLKASYPLENIPALGALKEYNQIGGQKTVGFLNFLLAANKEGRDPTMPAIVFRSPTDGGPSKSNGFRIGGIAIFNKDLKLIGFLNPKESETLRWVTGNLDKFTITAFVPQEKHYVSLDTSKLDSHIQPVIQGNKIKIYITLKGRGVIRKTTPV